MTDNQIAKSIQALLKLANRQVTCSDLDTDEVLWELAKRYPGSSGSMWRRAIIGGRAALRELAARKSR